MKNEYLIPSGMYHFLCGVCAGVFLLLAIYNETGLWALWATGCVISTCLSGFFRPSLDAAEVREYIRQKGYKL